jgi:hypothetical protein
MPTAREMAASGEFVVTVRPMTDPSLHMNVEACAAKWRQDYLGTLERCLTEPEVLLTEPDPSDSMAAARGYSYQDRGFDHVGAELLSFTHGAAGSRPGKVT